jgi:ABC-2 type transport system permease protein
MNIFSTLATAKRVLIQLSHDHRTMGLLILVPPLLITILKYVFDGDAKVFNNIAPVLLGIFPLIMMFLVTSIATLRERSRGTLDRLMTLPIAKVDILLGYMLAFSLVALVQVSITCLVMFGFLDVSITGDIWIVLLVAILSALLGTSAGLFASAFAQSEFQAVQFMPAFIFPQLLTCGLFIARDRMADFLHWISDFLPLTYCVDATKDAVLYSDWTSDLTSSILIMVTFIVGFVFLSVVSIKRLD